MAFNPTTAELWSEIEAAMRETDEHVEPSDAILRRLTGRWYKKSHETDPADPENFGYSFVSNILPQLGMDDPEVRVKPDRVIGHRIIGEAMKDGINSVVKDIGWVKRHRAVYMDFLRIRGVTLHYLDEETRFSRGAVTPQVKRINPSHVFLDTMEDDLEQVAFIGHWYYADQDDLLNDPRIDDAMKAKIVPSAQNDNVNLQAYDKEGDTKVYRKRVVMYSVWMRATNTLRWLCDCDKTRDIFPQQKYYGPPSGPYQFYDAYPVPNEVWPLSPLIAVEDQSRDLNIHAAAMGRAAARRKSIGLVESSNPDLGQKLVNAKDGEILAVKGITGQHVMIEVGGASIEQYQYTEYIRNRLDRVSGLTATVQGMVGKADTATEAEIAAQAHSGRVGYLKKQIKEASEGSLDKVGWFLFNTEGIVIAVSRRDNMTGQMTEGLFFGGPMPTDQGATWSDFGIVVELNTLQRQAQTKRDMFEYYQICAGIFPVMPQMPWVRWMNVLRDLGAPYGMEDKADDWVIPEMLGMVSQPDHIPPSAVLGPYQTPPRGRGTQGAIRSPHTPGGQPTGQPTVPGQGQPGGRPTIGVGGSTTGPRPNSQSTSLIGAA